MGCWEDLGRGPIAALHSLVTQPVVSADPPSGSNWRWFGSPSPRVIASTAACDNPDSYPNRQGRSERSNGIDLSSAVIFKTLSDPRRSAPQSSNRVELADVAPAGFFIL